jgi:hypothetical protein
MPSAGAGSARQGVGNVRRRGRWDAGRASLGAPPPTRPPTLQDVGWQAQLHAGLGRGHGRQGRCLTAGAQDGWFWGAGRGGCLMPPTPTKFKRIRSFAARRAWRRRRRRAGGLGRPRPRHSRYRQQQRFGGPGRRQAAVRPPDGVGVGAEPQLLQALSADRVEPFAIEVCRPGRGGERCRAARGSHLCRCCRPAAGEWALRAAPRGLRDHC